MTYKMYLLDIQDLEDKSLAEKAMTLIDDKRREIANKYCKEKDRLRAIAAVLLLQVGFLELEPMCFGKDKNLKADFSFLEQEIYEEGILYKVSCNELIAFFTEYLHNKVDSSQSDVIFPICIKYGEGTHGKPFWDKNAMCKNFPFKKYWYFNLSHSGNYVVLAISNKEIGVDIQEIKTIKKYPGGVQAFSRMEAYVKCTGDGFVYGHKEYEKHHGNVPGYNIENMQILEKYVLNICYENND